MNKREFLKLSSTASVGLVTFPLVSSLLGCSSANLDEFTLPNLGYALDALAPDIDAETMGIHHGRHHAGYVRKLNEALTGHALKGQTLEQLLIGLGPDDVALRRNGGGHFNHSLYWRILTPGGGAPDGVLLSRIEANFGSLEKLEGRLLRAAGTRFGSGWAWLCQGDENPEDLFICTTENQDNPLMKRRVKRTGRPLVGIDVWEHAYYLSYQNRRGDYIKAVLRRINWTEVAGLMA
jgi:superoxide dismutase, Fe-Mn family